MKATRIYQHPMSGTTATRTIWKGYLIVPEPSRFRRFLSIVRKLVSR